MMFNTRAKKELKLVQAFHKLFLDENGRLKKEAKDVIAFFRKTFLPYFLTNLITNKL